MRSGFFIGCIAILMWMHVPAHAENKKEKLEQTEDEQELAEKKAKELEKELAAIQADRTSIKSDLVRITKTLQAQERQLQKAEKREALIAAEIQSREALLAARERELQAMMAAAVRLSQMPPEAGLMMPEYSEKTIEAASALKLMTQAIKTRAEELRVQMIALNEDKEKAADIREDVEKQMKEIAVKRAELEKIFKSKNKLVSSVSAEQKKQAARAKQLAKDASSLKQLIAALEKALSSDARVIEKEKKKKEPRAVKAAANTGGSRGKLRSFSRAKGDIRPPSAGEVVGNFNSKSADEYSKGIIIQTATESTVSAPYDGEVVYSGAFRHYGNMVILKHSDGFHTLIAGLEKIRTQTGEFLLEGEPIGAMGDGDDSRKLYVELRKDNQPINPTPWFDGL
jgi:septal ring factor EnvC (AmiA/AmiB activator)